MNKLLELSNLITLDHIPLSIRANWNRAKFYLTIHSHKPMDSDIALLKEIKNTAHKFNNKELSLRF